MTRYALLTWPESQEYMELPGVFLCADNEEVGDSAYFVPEELLSKEYLDDEAEMLAELEIDEYIASEERKIREHDEVE